MLEATTIAAVSLFPSLDLKNEEFMAVNVFSYAATNVTTSAYVTILNATPVTASKIQIADTSGELLKLAVGLPGNEIDICTVPISGCCVIPYYLIAGQRLSLKAITANATNGYNTISLLSI